MVKEDQRGKYIATVADSDAVDERARLQVGDYLVHIGKLPVAQLELAAVGVLVLRVE